MHLDISLPHNLPMPDLDDYVSTQEAANQLGYHIDHVRRMLRQGDLEGLKVGITWLVSKKSVNKYLKETEGKNKFDPTRGNE